MKSRLIGYFIFDTISQLVHWILATRSLQPRDQRTKPFIRCGLIGKLLLHVTFFSRLTALQSPFCFSFEKTTATLIKKKKTHQVATMFKELKKQQHKMVWHCSNDEYATKLIAVDSFVLNIRRGGVYLDFNRCLERTHFEAWPVRRTDNIFVDDYLIDLFRFSLHRY